MLEGKTIVVTAATSSRRVRAGLRDPQPMDLALTRGIRMNCVSPGPVDTPILPDFIETLGERAEEDMKIMDRPGLPTDIAPVVAFLQSDDSRWFRGANLTAYGGMSSHIMMHTHGLKA